MNVVKKALSFHVVSESSWSKFASVACYVVAVAILILGTLEIGALQPSEFELLLGTLSVIALSVLFVVLGTLIEVNERLRVLQASQQKYSEP